MLQPVLYSYYSDLVPSDIGNAIGMPGWTIIASNVRMQNGIGVLYGVIKHTSTTGSPEWEELIGKFPDFFPIYWIPLTLFSMRGEIVASAAVNPQGEIRLYRPGLAYMGTETTYHFHAVYFMA